MFFDFPLEGLSDDQIRVTMSGETNEVFQEALFDVADYLKVTVERLGPYPAEPAGVRSALTERQQESLDVATDLGYYEVPQQATNENITDRIQLNSGTVSERLKAITTEPEGKSSSTVRLSASKRTAGFSPPSTSNMRASDFRITHVRVPSGCFETVLLWANGCTQQDSGRTVPKPFTES